MLGSWLVLHLHVVEQDAQVRRCADQGVAHQPEPDVEVALRGLQRDAVLGEGRERASLERLVKELGLEQDVSLPGFVDNPYSYMSRAGAFVLSSRWEGLPTVLVEALYCGVPLVATDCPSGPREILQNGQLGSLVPVGSVDQMAQAIHLALEGAGPKATRDSWHPYTLDAVVKKYLEVLFPE